LKPLIVGRIFAEVRMSIGELAREDAGDEIIEVFCLFFGRLQTEDSVRLCLIEGKDDRVGRGGIAS
jgi:hypothetical protein